jgi:hypothetical protein
LPQGAVVVAATSTAPTGWRLLLTSTTATQGWPKAAQAVAPCKWQPGLGAVRVGRSGRRSAAPRWHATLRRGGRFAAQGTARQGTGHVVLYLRARPAAPASVRVRGKGGPRIRPGQFARAAQLAGAPLHPPFTSLQKPLPLQPGFPGVPASTRGGGGRPRQAIAPAVPHVVRAPGGRGQHLPAAPSGLL